MIKAFNPRPNSATKQQISTLSNNFGVRRKNYDNYKNIKKTSGDWKEQNENEFRKLEEDIENDSTVPAPTQTKTKIIVTRGAIVWQ